MLTDTHAHLDFPQFAPEVPEIVARAEAAGVTRIVTIGTTLEGNARTLALAEQFPSVHASVGVHPNSVMETLVDFIPQLREQAKHRRVVAIGEAGLDYYRLPDASAEEITKIKEAQTRAFRLQLDLAVELGLNVIVHERDAWDDTLNVLRDYTGKVRAVLHCFGKTPAHAEEVTALGHLVSFTGIVTFKNAPDSQQTAATIPSGKFMVETDCPFLAPVPHRGKRCEPAFTRLVAEHIAKLRNTTLEAIATETEATANGFFRFR